MGTTLAKTSKHAFVRDVYLCVVYVKCMANHVYFDKGISECILQASIHLFCMQGLYDVSKGMILLAYLNCNLRMLHDYISVSVSELTLSAYKRKLR